VAAEADPGLLERRRGRPSPERAAAIEGMIRAAGLEVFLEAGYEAANMDEVAARAGVSKATLYTRFDSKEALFRAVVAAQVGQVGRYAEGGFARLPPDLEPMLRFHARAILNAFRSEEFRRLDRLMNMARTSFPELAALTQGLLQTDYGDVLAEALADAARNDGAGAMDWRFVANLLINGIAGWYLNESQLRTLSEAEGEQFCDRLVALILAAARARA
jgi:TetR/AcrR family transcriptional regulator, mexJK operon transcriptional repressor